MVELTIMARAHRAAAVTLANARPIARAEAGHGATDCAPAPPGDRDSVEAEDGGPRGSFEHVGRDRPVMARVGRATKSTFSLRGEAI